MSNPQSAPPLSPNSGPPTNAQKWRIPIIFGAVGLVVGVLIGGVGLGVVTSIQESQKESAAASAAQKAEDSRAAQFPNAVRACGADTSYAVVDDGGKTLTLELQGNDDFAGLNISDLTCIMNSLDAPQSVLSHMDQTTSMDGRQTETWDGITVAFSYHPDRGMDSVLTLD
jgi:hypothetical protein